MIRYFYHKIEIIRVLNMMYYSSILLLQLKETHNIPWSCS